jgi:NAD(P)-dependent dehydrogenase (short-subunit alcohol dehydrogenase family)
VRAVPPSHFRVTAGVAQLLADKDVGANAVVPGPIRTPLIASTLSEEAVANFGKQVPMRRPGEPAEFATAHLKLGVFVWRDVSGTTLAVTSGKSIL